jgi:hypothetical protein
MMCSNKDNITNTLPDLNQSGYGYDELKDFDMGYRGGSRSRIIPFRGPIR